MRKRTLKAFAGALVAAALVVAPLVTAGASAEDASAVWPADTVGVKGELVPWNEDTNHTDYWKQKYPDAVSCYSSDGDTDHGRITGGGKTVTLNEYSPSWPGDHWEVLVIKAGNLWNSVIENPDAGVAYASPPNNSGQQASVSHWIVCKGKTTVPELVTPTLTWTLPTCEAAGELFQGDGVKWVSTPGENGSTIWTATPAPGKAFPAGVTTQWTVPDLSKLVQGCGSNEPEQPDPLESESSKTTFDCATTTATITTTTTTTAYVWNAETKTWVLGEPTSSDVVTERPLTEAEIGANCPLVPGDIDSVCVGDVPYLGYELTLPEGFVADSETPVTITFVNPDGEDYVVENQPLSGELLWPGASATAPKMWPGWELVNGEYVETDGNYAWTRAGVTVRFEVNPSYSTEVQYPEASAECANPPIGGGTPASTDAEALAVTGGGVSPVIVAAGGAALLAGIAVVAIAAYRRRHASVQ
ncbi:hypothetical protein Q9R08_09865 [Microbacterium sp. QXD-8]|uniref:Uncharacterized protein n=1 Tax=Microbacterium psychrotolerans TaxID=3068321 RepID=A0ABU0Z115_9MICO|nr:hypothetical protein [Microbacterium sp. QXD-8]MDQ7878277.1 hypothetical protein [Microbacterium sp. QXD-8]